MNTTKLAEMVLDKVVFAALMSGFAFFLNSKIEGMKSTLANSTADRKERIERVYAALDAAVRWDLASHTLCAPEADGGLAHAGPSFADPVSIEVGTTTHNVLAWVPEDVADVFRSLPTAMRDESCATTEKNRIDATCQVCVNKRYIQDYLGTIIRDADWPKGMAAQELDLARDVCRKSCR